MNIVENADNISKNKHYQRLERLIPYSEDLCKLDPAFDPNGSIDYKQCEMLNALINETIVESLLENISNEPPINQEDIQKWNQITKLKPFKKCRNGGPNKAYAALIEEAGKILDTKIISLKKGNSNLSYGLNIHVDSNMSSETVIDHSYGTLEITAKNSEERDFHGPSYEVLSKISNFEGYEVLSKELK